ncbi:hypothetical protein BJ508DRAFT_412825 [Ascobolus immersus RN42]|uniref:Uncharacterized protein n=1 Tax=Ascobolus immersus RN42 TaxID=1160509 RepID=A0A3N4IS84_ASCIM|nr:hypothetical protein BJ508DRAFT_412825 [Ascobolus immersus RN42]
MDELEGYYMINRADKTWLKIFCAGPAADEVTEQNVGCGWQQILNPSPPALHPSGTPTTQPIASTSTDSEITDLSSRVRSMTVEVCHKCNPTQKQPAVVDCFQNGNPSTCTLRKYFSAPEKFHTIFMPNAQGYLVDIDHLKPTTLDTETNYSPKMASMDEAALIANFEKHAKGMHQSAALELYIEMISAPHRLGLAPKNINHFINIHVAAYTLAWSTFRFSICPKLVKRVSDRLSTATGATYRPYNYSPKKNAKQTAPAIVDDNNIDLEMFSELFESLWEDAKEAEQNELWEGAPAEDCLTENMFMTLVAFLVKETPKHINDSGWLGQLGQTGCDPIFARVFVHLLPYMAVKR